MQRREDEATTPGPLGLTRGRGEVKVATVVVPLADLAPGELGRPRGAVEAGGRPGDAVGAGESPRWRWTVAVRGTCHRNSTTAADRRREALFSATRFIEIAKRVVRAESRRLGATITHAPCAPDTGAAVPGEYLLCLELHDTDAASVGRVYDRLAREAWTIGRLSRSTFTFSPDAANPPVLYELADVPAPRLRRGSAANDDEATDSTSARAG